MSTVNRFIQSAKDRQNTKQCKSQVQIVGESRTNKRYTAFSVEKVDFECIYGLTDSTEEFGVSLFSLLALPVLYNALLTAKAEGNHEGLCSSLQYKQVEIMQTMAAVQACNEFK